MRFWPKRSEAAGQLAEAQGTVATALAVAAQTGQPFFDADLHRLDGDLLLATGGTADEAAARYHRALAIAREQGARSFELRAATSLARLWRDQGKRAEARALLAPVYAEFTEGFATRDLIDAKALLDELGVEGRLRPTPPLRPSHRCEETWKAPNDDHTVLQYYVQDISPSATCAVVSGRLYRCGNGTQAHPSGSSPRKIRVHPPCAGGDGRG